MNNWPNTNFLTFCSMFNKVLIKYLAHRWGKSRAWAQTVYRLASITPKCPCWTCLPVVLLKEKYKDITTLTCRDFSPSCFHYSIKARISPFSALQTQWCTFSSLVTAVLAYSFYFSLLSLYINIYSIYGVPLTEWVMARGRVRETEGVISRLDVFSLCLRPKKKKKILHLIVEE